MMQWTSDAPTEAGFYWVRTCADDAEVVRVARDHGGLYVMTAGSDDDESIREYAPHCEWCGPLTPPSK